MKGKRKNVHEKNCRVWWFKACMLGASHTIGSFFLCLEKYFALFWFKGRIILCFPFIFIYFFSFLYVLQCCWTFFTSFISMYKPNNTHIFAHLICYKYVVCLIIYSFCFIPCLSIFLTSFLLLLDFTVEKIRSAIKEKNVICFCYFFSPRLWVLRKRAARKTIDKIYFFYLTSFSFGL